VSVRRALWLLLFVCGVAFVSVSNATAAPPAAANQSQTPLDRRIDQIIPLLIGVVEPENFFDPRFLSKVASSAQMKAFAEGVIRQFGKPLNITEIKQTDKTNATLKIAFEKVVAIAEVNIDPAPPHQIIGFRIVPDQPVVEDDSLAKIEAELTALPGRVGYIIERIGEDGGRTTVAGRATGEQFAIGSIFKLYILAELATQIDAGTRRWSDTTPLTRRSFSSPATQSLPLGTPVTLEQLASWMIAVSDNAASDELLFLLGRDRIEARVRIVGHSAPEKTLPFLSTVEAFLLKSDYKGTRAKYVGASEAKQRALLKRKISGVGFEKINLDNLIAKPAAIDSIEWFAAPNDIVLLMDHLRRMNNTVALEIMAKSVAPATAKRWQYVGSKGGSELGVIATSVLAQAPSGSWHVISGSWNNPSQAVDENRFIALMQRALNSVAE
jgi:beta-lactamase class A